VVINDFHVVSISIFPLEAYAPLLINTDTELPCTVTAQCFKTVTWRSAEQVDLAATALFLIEYNKILA